MSRLAPAIRSAERLSPIACLAVACVGGSAAPEPIDPCDTQGSAPATSGGDHGPPWQGFPEPPADDTAGEKLDVSWGDLLIPDVPPPMAVDWQEDLTTGVQYRRLTENEIENNRWNGNLLLVALEDSFVADVKSAKGKVMLELPLADAHPSSLQEGLPVISVQLIHQSSRNFAGTVEHVVKTTGVSVITAQRPVFHSYIQKDLDWGTVDDVAIHLFAQGSGGIIASGATYGRTFWLEGPQKDYSDIITIDIEPEPGHQAFLLHTHHGYPLSEVQLGDDQTALHIANRRAQPPTSAPAALAAPIAGLGVGINQCTDGLNNDPDLDDVADGCDFACMPHPDFGTDLYPGVVPMWEYARPFAVVGTAEWCTAHPNDWEDLLQASGRVAEEMLNWVEAPATFPGPRVPPFRLVGLHCWVFMDPEQGLDCHNYGACPPGYENYPFQNVGDTWISDVASTTYLDRAWGAADAWASDALAMGRSSVIHPLQNIAVVVSRKDPAQAPGIVGLAYSHEAPDSRVGGVVVLGTNTILDGFGAWVSAEDIDPIVVGRAIAHEIGHTHGLAHDSTYFDGGHSFMYDFGGLAPLLGEDVDSTAINYNAPPAVPPTLYSQYEAWTLLAPLKSFPRPPGFSYVGCTKTPDNCPQPLTCTDTLQGHECLP